MTTEWLIQYRYLDNLEDIYRRELFETATGPATTKMMTKHKSYDNVDVFFFNERQCDSDCDKEDNDKEDADSGKDVLCSSAITSWLKIEQLPWQKRRWGKQYGWLEGQYCWSVLTRWPSWCVKMTTSSTSVAVPETTKIMTKTIWMFTELTFIKDHSLTK